MARPGERFGRYTLVRPLPPRGAGEVWAASSDDGRPVSLTLAPPSKRDPAEAKRLMERNLGIATLIRHENMVHVLDGGIDDGVRWVVTELVDGVPLSKILEMLRAAGSWPTFGVSGFVIHEVARALEYLHAFRTPFGDASGLAHRDVAPRSIVVERSGTIKLSDMMSGADSPSLVKTAGRELSGLFAYLSPELAANGHVDARSDVFALGAVLWELLTGRSLFLRGSDLETLAAVRTAEIPSTPPDCPRELADIARHCLSKRPEDRPTAADVVRELARVVISFPDAGPDAGRALVERAIELGASGPTDVPRGPERPRRSQPPTDTGAPQSSDSLDLGLTPDVPASAERPVPSSDLAPTPDLRPSLDVARDAQSGPSSTKIERHHRTLRSDPPSAAVVHAPPPRHDHPDPFYDPSRDVQRWGNRFEVIERLGAGGMGEVYKVRDKELDEVVAIKLIPRESTMELRSTERLKREVRLARKISSPFVCRIYDIVDLGDGVRGLTMAVIDGTTLAELMRGGLYVDYQRIARWGADIAEGLSAAHELGIVHRDLKPENVMIRSDDRAVILDFGIAFSAENMDLKLTQAGMIMGTPLYMSPEQLVNQPLDGRSDLFALGLILAELITGEVPMRGGTYAELLEKRVTRPERYSIKDIDPAVPGILAETIDDLLRLGAADRPVSSLEISARLRAFTGRSSGQYPQGPRSSEPPRPVTAPLPEAPAPVSTPPRVDRPPTLPIPVDDNGVIVGSEDPTMLPSPRLTGQAEVIAEHAHHDAHGQAQRRTMMLMLGGAAVALLLVALWIIRARDQAETVRAALPDASTTVSAGVGSTEAPNPGDPAAQRDAATAAPDATPKPEHPDAGPRPVQPETIPEPIPM
ncbi:protein kinase [Myxococcota bacterium]|nr:protein kinase [Myxococcota bacterium]